MSTRDASYTAHLATFDPRKGKYRLGAQAPYRWNLRRLRPGYTLDLGCGVGRNLGHLDGNGVGIDHNELSVAEARARGLNALTVDEFEASPFNRVATYDSLLCAHVIEHMTTDEATALIDRYLSLVKPEGRLILITPQEAGHRQDATHVTFMDFAAHEHIGRGLGLSRTRQLSFPFPRFVGRFFLHNEFVTVWKRDLHAL
jgi:2-polyprenyl-3-methyl-5-hydroxy-6-metoxy-1,4-benzoquinol methylase